MNYTKLRAVYAVFTKGQVVSDPVLWKKSQITVGMITGLLAAIVGLARAFGYVLPITDEQLVQIGGAVVAVWGMLNSGATLASTTSIGLPPLPEPSSPVDSPSAPKLPNLPTDPKPELPRERYIARNGEIRDAAKRE